MVHQIVKYKDQSFLALDAKLLPHNLIEGQPEQGKEAVIHQLCSISLIESLDAFPIVYFIDHLGQYKLLLSGVHQRISSYQHLQGIQQGNCCSCG